MKFTVKNMPRLKLVDLLRRRKMTLRQLINEFGITTYDGLVNRCDRLGVVPPTEGEFKIAFPDKPVNDPQEGVIVLEPPVVIDEIFGRKIDPEAQPIPQIEIITELSVSREESQIESVINQKKVRKKKENYNADDDEKSR